MKLTHYLISLGTTIVMFRYNKSEERYKAKAKIVGNIYGVAYDLKIHYNNFLVTRLYASYEELKKHPDPIVTDAEEKELINLNKSCSEFSRLVGEYRFYTNQKSDIQVHIDRFQTQSSSY
ncbi:MAG TPA: hypothetical protein VK826_07795 [Bacteroidia bacterium]|nr:hypothetical protein [Bacteroidia bacterium]